MSAVGLVATLYCLRMALLIAKHIRTFAETTLEAARIVGEIMLRRRAVLAEAD